MILGSVCPSLRVNLSVPVDRLELLVMTADSGGFGIQSLRCEEYSIVVRLPGYRDTQLRLQAHSDLILQTALMQKSVDNSLKGDL